MKIIKSKIIAIITAMFLMLSMSASMMLLPTANAHTPAWNIPTFAFISATPNPCGVGQPVYIYFWLSNLFDPATALINNYRFHNYILTITAPNGAVETKTWPVVADSTSNQGYSYTPTQVGTYTLNFTFPGQAITLDNDSPTSAYINDTYMPSSASTTVTVQQQPIPVPIDSYPLPTNYWTRPIYGENPYWFTISSNWLGSGAPGYGSMIGPNSQMFPGDAVGSTTSHIMWTKPVQEGGVVGGDKYLTQGTQWFGGTAYDPRFQNPIILFGMLYYTEPVSFAGYLSGPTDCIDLRTGQLIWSRSDVPALSFGYVYDVETPNHHGVYQGILFTASFARAFDAYTGDQLFNVTGVPTGATVLGPQGEQLKYVLANAGDTVNPDWRLGQWNSSHLIFLRGGASPAITNMTGTTVAMSDGVLPGTLIVDGSVSNQSLTNCRYDWNFSVAWLNKMATANGGASPVTEVAAFYGNMMLCRNGSYPALGPGLDVPYTYFAVNLNASRGPVGSILWMNTVNPPAGNITTVSYAGADPKAGVFCESYRQTMQFVGYNLNTGQQIWGPTASQAALDYYGSPGPGTLDDQVAYGKLYSDGMAGILYCYDLTTGQLLWTYGNGGAGNSTNAGLSNSYGVYPTMINAVGNGIVYTTTCEHTITNPIYKGSLARAINATTGQEIWTVSAYTGQFNSNSYAIADGYSTFFNEYDSQIYIVGQGPSVTTIQAPLTAINAEDKVVIQGTVMDISAGTKQNQQATDFPNGVPCASDTSMTDWMGYVYQQKPLPTNFEGVSVSISAIDPNSNPIPIGTAVTDSSGLYHFTWTTPNISGDYLVTATFAGTNGYWPSSAQTAMTVNQAVTTASPLPVQVQPPTEMYFVVSTAAIIIAIAIGFAVTILMLKRRP